MDVDVDNLLESWGLSDYSEKFAVNKIDLNSLGLLTGELIKELIGPIGDRARFTKNLNEWNAMTNSLQDSPFEGDGNVDVLNNKHRDITISQLNATSRKQEVTLPSDISLGSIDIEGIDSFQILDYDSNNNYNTPLREILQKSLEGRGLINLYSESGLLSNIGRRKICNIIVKHLLELDPNKRISSSTLLHYAQQIKTIFEKENISTYFVPYLSNSKLKLKRCAKGKLYDCLQNRKREYRESQVTSNKNPNAEIDTSESHLQDTGISDDALWLTNSSDPWSLVENKWKKTIEFRRKELNSSNLTIESYMNTYPALKKPAGYNLLMSDFKSQFPDSDSRLTENFPLYKNKILDITVEKYSRHPDTSLKQFTEEYMNYKKKEHVVTALTNEVTSIYAFMFLPLLLGNPVAKNKKKTYRPSKQESREAFITHINAATELQETITLRKKKYSKHGLTFQPTIFIVGPTLHEIKQYYIAVNDTLYTVNSIIEAVDVTFKLFYSLNCEYPAECNVYNFLQKGFYKISTTWDKEYTCVNALLADLNMQL